MRESEILRRLEERLGADHARRRLGVERDLGTHGFGAGRRRFHLTNWYSIGSVIRAALKLTGLYDRAARNALDVRLLENHVVLEQLPKSLTGLRVLHLSDLHLDMSDEILHVIIERVRGVDHDLCVLTGDYRFRTFGPIDAAVSGMRQLRANLSGPVFAVLGNHDSVSMLPEFEDMDIRLLINESHAYARGDAHLYFAGVDDAHFLGLDNIDKALAGVPDSVPKILLSHTPEIYRQAADAGVHLLLCGHTHGGQLCLPGGHPVTLEARIPRRLGRGPWMQGGMQGYTSAGAGSSLVAARLNCPPEITVHVLQGPPGT